MKLNFASSNKNNFIEVEKINPKNIKLGNLIELNIFEESQKRRILLREMQPLKQII